MSSAALTASTEAFGGGHEAPPEVKSRSFAAETNDFLLLDEEAAEDAEDAAEGSLKSLFGGGGVKRFALSAESEDDLGAGTDDCRVDLEDASDVEDDPIFIDCTNSAKSLAKFVAKFTMSTSKDFDEDAEAPSAS